MANMIKKFSKHIFQLKLFFLYQRDINTKKYYRFTFSSTIWIIQTADVRKWRNGKFLPQKRIERIAKLFKSVKNFRYGWKSWWMHKSYCASVSKINLTKFVCNIKETRQIYLKFQMYYDSWICPKRKTKQTGNNRKLHTNVSWTRRRRRLNRWPRTGIGAYLNVNNKMSKK